MLRDTFGQRNQFRYFGAKGSIGNGSASQLPKTTNDFKLRSSKWYKVPGAGTIGGIPA
jgi:hypothetical protein